MMIEGQNDLDNTPRIPTWRGYLYVFIFWGLISCSIYLTFFVLWYSGLVPFAFVQPLFKRKIQKYRLSIIPFQKRLGKQLEKYQRFVVFRNLWRRSFTANCGLMGAGFMLLGAALLVFLVNYGHPALDLGEMVMIRGRFLNFKKLPKGAICGHYLLSFNQLNSFQKTKWQGFYNGSDQVIKNLQMSKEDLFTVWGQPNTRNINPECRKFPTIKQILGPRFQNRYRKDFAIKANRFSTLLYLFLSFCGSFCILRALWINRQQK